MRQGVAKAWIAVLLLAGGNLVDAQETRVVSEAHAKGIVVLRASFPSRGELHSFGLEISLDGKTFVNAKAGPTRGLRFSYRMVLGSHTTDQTVLVVPIVGRFGFTPEGFLFEREGIYHLRWDIAFTDRDVGDLRIEQTVVVGAPTEADLQFLARAGDRGFQAEVLGLDPPERGTTDLLALGLISGVLEYAQDDPGEEGRFRGELSWADAMMDLAREFPESSYAPYATFFAGRVYHGHLGKAVEPEIITPDAKKHPFYKKSDEALRFAVDHGDAFLKPRALCSLAFLRACATLWDDAENLLTQSLRTARGQRVIGRVVGKLRRDIPRLKERMQEQQEEQRD